MSLPDNSIFNLFTIGIGPSSSHTVGPMKAAKQFAGLLVEHGLISKTDSVRTDLFGSLALTGKGHGTDKAVLLGLWGKQPDLVEPEEIERASAQLKGPCELSILDEYIVPFDPAKHMRFNYKEWLPAHPNGIKFTAFNSDDGVVSEQIFYSVGGGVVVTGEEAMRSTPILKAGPIPHQFDSAATLLSICKAQGMAIHEVVMENEKCWQDEKEIRSQLLRIWQVMQDCVKRGCSRDGVLPGGLNVSRRAPQVYRELTANPERALRDPLSIIDWVNLYALAVNEENASGGRVVTAPTNGAAGIIPAVLHYYERFSPSPSEDGIIRFLLTAGAIGLLYKQNASISGAEVGCQGEVGVACSMAAAGLVATIGGTNDQVESAAEIGMEHNLGLTCDPVGGLVQIPCIERNAMGAVKAINAMRIAMRGDGTHKVSLDQVITTMRETGKDMKSHYKETSQGGLAVNVIEC